MCSLSKLIVSSFSSRLINSFLQAAWDNASSSAFIIKVVTVACLLVYHPTVLPNNCIKYAYELFLSNILSANKVLL